MDGAGEASIVAWLEVRAKWGIGPWTTRERFENHGGVTTGDWANLPPCPCLVSPRM